MKKILFATTALIATASVAAADVRISGYGRFGLDYNDANDTAVNGISSTTLTTRLRLQFDMSTETDSGVGFNARLRIQGDSRDNNGKATNAGRMGLNGARFGVSYGGLLVNVGNIIGAVENTPGLYTTGTRSAGTGIDGMGYNSLVLQGTAWDAYSSAGVGANGVEALYTAGGFTGHISYSAQNDALAAPFNASDESRTAIMGTYSWSDYYGSISYQASSGGVLAAGGQELNDGIYMIAFGGSWNQFGGRIAYGSTEAAKSLLLEGYMDIGAASNILLWVNNVDRNAGITSAVTGNNIVADGTNWGVNYQYDLGGGATFVAGYVSSKFVNAANVDTDQNQVQAGVYFSF